MNGWTRFAVITIALAAGGTAGYYLHLPPDPVIPTFRAITFSDRDSEPAASPDGSRIAFVSSRDGGIARIWILEAGIERPITDGEDAHPRFSADGRHILYAHAGALYSIGLDGGEPHLVLNDAVDGDWSRSGAVVALRKKHGPTAGWSVEVADKGSITDFETMDLSGPRWSPDGRHIAMRRKIKADPEPESILIMDSDGKNRTTIPSMPGGYNISAPAWINNEELVYVQSLSPSRTSPSSRLVHFRLSNGAATPLFMTPRMARTVDALPNGRFVFDSGFTRQNLREWTADNERWLTRGDSIDREPAYSPDSPWILFSSNRSGKSALWETSTENLSVRPVKADGNSPFFAPRDGMLFWTSTAGGAREIWSTEGQLTHAGDNPESPAISRDGRHIFYQNFTGFHRINRDGSDHQVIHPDLCFYPDVSPNGKFIACAYGTTIQFLSADDGHMLPVKIEDAARPKWMPDGKSVAFIGNNGKSENSILTQPFDPARDTNKQRRVFAVFDLNPETFAISPDGAAMTISLTDPVSNLMIVDK